MIQKLVKKLHKNKKGFTLIELIVVIVILGVLAAILIPTVSGYVNNAKQKVANADAKSVYTAALAVQASNPDISYTSYVSNNTNATDSIIGGGDLDTYLGTHSSFTDANITITFDTTDTSKIVKVTVAEGGITGSYTP